METQDRPTLKEGVSPLISRRDTPPPLPPPPELPLRIKTQCKTTIRIGDVEVPLREHHHRSQEREKRKATKSGVTEEARKVLEQFLKDPSEDQLKRHSSRQAQSEREYVEECPYMFLQSNESYYGNRCYLKRDFERGFLTDGNEPLFFDEPDYAEPAEPEEEEEEEFEQIPETQADIDAALAHQHVSKTNSMSSQSSFGLGPRSNPTSRSRSPSDRHILAVHPPQIKGRPKVKGKKYKELLDESSSSTEDYEYTENYLVSRKKKSFFKWASERLRQSFRRSHKLQPSLHDQLEASKDAVPTIEEQLVTDDQEHSTPKSKSGTPKKSNKLKFAVKRSGSEKGSKSSSTPNEGLNDALLTQDIAVVSESDSIVLRTEDTDQTSATDQAGAAGSERTTERTGERRRKSPVPWKRYEIKAREKKSCPPAEGGTTKEKGLFDSFLKHIRKGSSKLKRKGSKEDSVRQRSRSADNLVLQPLSKEHEKVLQRYITSKKESEYDSDSTTVRSFHEVMAHRVEQQSLPPIPRPSVVWYPPPMLPLDEAPYTTEHQSLRRTMHLEGLVPCHSDSQLVPDCEAHYSLEYDCQLTEQVATTTTHGQDQDLSILREIKEQQRICHVKPSESEDDVDGGPHFGQIRKPRPRRLKLTPLDIASKPFNERTDREKDELYEKIAEQLAMIADQYNFGSPRSSKSLSSPTQSRTHSRSHSHSHSRSHSHSAPSQSENEDNAEAAKEENVCPLECSSGGAALEERLGALIQEKTGARAQEMPPDIPPMMAELVRTTSYSHFKQMFNENIGSEPGWQQIAMMFRLTQTAVQVAGFGTAVALQIKEMTLKYFEDKFAGWIVGQGGWESVVENDSELD